MKPDEAVASIEAVAQKLREAADALAAAAGPIRKSFSDAAKAQEALRLESETNFNTLKESAEKSEADLKRTSKSLQQAETSLASAEESLAAMEGTVLEMIAAATHALHDPDVPLKGRQRMLGLAKLVFAQLKTAGFEVIIPEIGIDVDPSRHTIKGRAKSQFDGTRVADVVAWGYRFPSGAGKSAEILVGDASLAAVEEEPLPEEPSEKAGIKMMVDEELQATKTKAKATTKKKEPETMFEKLAEAAEKNTK